MRYRFFAGRDFDLKLTSSHALAEFPACDLAFLDGDRSLAGLSSDLEKASRSAQAILSMITASATRCRQPWGLPRPQSWLTFGVDRLRRPRPQAGPLDARPAQVLRLAVPAGIGDALWAMLKVPGAPQGRGGGRLDIDICWPRPTLRGAFRPVRFRPPHRLHHARNAEERADSARPTASGITLRPAKARITATTGCSSPMLIWNGACPLEDWLPQFAIDWNIPRNGFCRRTSGLPTR